MNTPSFTASDVVIYVEQPPDETGQPFLLDQLDLDGNVVRHNVDPADVTFGPPSGIVWYHQRMRLEGSWVPGWTIHADPGDGNTRVWEMAGQPEDAAHAVAKALDLLLGGQHERADPRLSRPDGHGRDQAPRRLHRRRPRLGGRVVAPQCGAARTARPGHPGDQRGEAEQAEPGDDRDAAR